MAYRYQADGGVQYSDNDEDGEGSLCYVLYYVPTDAWAAISTLYNILIIACALRNGEGGG